MMVLVAARSDSRLPVMDMMQANCSWNVLNLPLRCEHQPVSRCGAVGNNLVLLRFLPYCVVIQQPVRVKHTYNASPHACA